MKKLVIIPAYNEEKNIVRVIEDLQQNAPDFDYVIINDCSTDNLKKVCEDRNYNIINLPVNLGIGGGVQTGYKYARDHNYDVAIQFDGDGQHDAKYIHKMLECLQEENLDMVIGSRFIDKQGFQSSLSRRAGIKILSFLIKQVTGQVVLDVTSGFRMVNRKGISEFCTYYPKDYPEPESIVSILRNGGKIKEIPVEMKARKEGKTSINLIKSIYYMIKVSLAILIDIIKPARKEVDYGTKITDNH